MKSHNYYAQFNEDKILNKIFNKKTGQCVEVGGFDGVTGSNTYFFEKIGWRCLIVEPMPDFCQKIKSVRKCEIAELAASNKAGTVEFYVAAGVETLSTIEKNDQHFARIKSLSDKAIRKITVKTARLNDILLEHQMTNIDFLTIDVEGHEMSVLLGMSFDEIKPRILIIEDNSNGADDEVKRFMESVSYKRFMRTGCNDWYAKTDDELVTVQRRFLVEVLIAWRRFRSYVKRIIRH